MYCLPLYMYEIDGAPKATPGVPHFHRILPVVASKAQERPARSDALVEQLLSGLVVPTQHPDEGQVAGRRQRAAVAVTVRVRGGPELPCHRVVGHVHRRDRPADDPRVRCSGADAGRVGAVVAGVRVTTGLATRADVEVVRDRVIRL